MHIAKFGPLFPRPLSPHGFSALASFEPTAYDKQLAREVLGELRNARRHFTANREDHAIAETEIALKKLPQNYQKPFPYIAELHSLLGLSLYWSLKPYQEIALYNPLKKLRRAYRTLQKRTFHHLKTAHQIYRTLHQSESRRQELTADDYSQWTLVVDVLERFYARKPEERKRLLTDHLGVLLSRRDDRHLPEIGDLQRKLGTMYRRASDYAAAQEFYQAAIATLQKTADIPGMPEYHMEALHVMNLALAGYSETLSNDQKPEMAQYRQKVTLALKKRLNARLKTP